QLVARNRGIHRDRVAMAAGLEPLDGVDRGIHVAEHAQHSRRRRRLENGAQGSGERQHQCAPTRWGGGSTSLTSEIDTAGKFFTNSRSHMKNQPKRPAMKPQS